MLPGEVTELAPRMRQIATIVYTRGGATIDQIQASIEDGPGKHAIKTLSNRLVNRGILKRRRSGHHTEMLYLPTIIDDLIENFAVDALVNEHFGGSPELALQHVLRMIARERHGQDG